MTSTSSPPASTAASNTKSSGLFPLKARFPERNRAFSRAPSTRHPLPSARPRCKIPRKVELPGARSTARKESRRERASAQGHPPRGRSLVECGSLLPLCGGSGLPEGGGGRGGARRGRRWKHWCERQRGRCRRKRHRGRRGPKSVSCASNPPGLAPGVEEDEGTVGRSPFGSAANPLPHSQRGSASIVSHRCFSGRSPRACPGGEGEVECVGRRVKGRPLRPCAGGAGGWGAALSVGLHWDKPSGRLWVGERAGVGSALASAGASPAGGGKMWQSKMNPLYLIRFSELFYAYGAWTLLSISLHSER